MHTKITAHNDKEYYFIFIIHTIIFSLSLNVQIPFLCIDVPP